MTSGTVYWVTGLSAAGKTTIGRALYERLRGRARPVVFLDGDTLREVFGNDLGFERLDRQKSAMRNGRLCKLLADQGLDVVCATISMFHACRQWNREQIPHYREIYVRAPAEVLRQRDSKRLYEGAASGQIRDVVGVDIEAEEPESPDVTIDNDGTRTVDALVDQVMEALGIGEGT